MRTPIKTPPKLTYIGTHVHLSVQVSGIKPFIGKFPYAPEEIRECYRRECHLPAYLFWYVLGKEYIFGQTIEEIRKELDITPLSTI